MPDPTARPPAAEGTDTDAEGRIALERLELEVGRAHRDGQGRIGIHWFDLIPVLSLARDGLNANAVASAAPPITAAERAALDVVSAMLEWDGIPHEALRVVLTLARRAGAAATPNAVRDGAVFRLTRALTECTEDRWPAVSPYDLAVLLGIDPETVAGGAAATPRVESTPQVAGGSVVSAPKLQKSAATPSDHATDWACPHDGPNICGECAAREGES